MKVRVITKRSVDQLSANGTAALRDRELPGFCCRRNQNGSISYFVEYRAGRGRKFPVRRLVIGRHGQVTPDQARQAAKLVLSEVAQGKDPVARRAARLREPTVADVLEDALSRHWRPKRKPSTVKSFKQIIYGRLIPAFGPLRLNDLRRTDIRRWHAELHYIPIRANRSLAVLRKALSIAVADELITVNPAKGIVLHPERARDRTPTDSEMKGVWIACSDPKVQAAAGLLFRLLILTGCRSGELRTARTEWLSQQDRVLRLSDSKSGARDILLSRQAMSLLPECPGEWLVPNRRGTGPLSAAALRDAWETIRKLAGVQSLRVHDLRHGFGTRAASLGANALVLRDALGHKTLAMTNRYVSRQLTPVRELADRLGAHIESVVGQ